MQTLFQTLLHTPWWVYLLFAYLIKVGIDASKTRIVALRRLFIIPAVFTFMSIHTLIASFPISLFTVATWSLTILLGMTLGWFQVYRYQLLIDKKHKLLQIPGNWSTMIIILIIFAAKYYFGYEQAVDPELAKQTFFEFSALAVSGICTGLFIGRLICYLYRFHQDMKI